MAHEIVKKKILVSQFPTIVEGGPTAGGLVDFNATGDKFSYAPVRPAKIWRFGIIVKTAMNPDAGGFDLALDLRPTVGSDTSRVEKVVLNRADAELVAAGGIVYKDVVLAVAESEVTGLSATTNKVNVGPDGPLDVSPGQEVVLEVTNAVGAASDGYVWMEVSEDGFDISDANVTAD
jgi:hypothetical protein